MTVDYDRRIARAEELKSAFPESSTLLSFYTGLASIQCDAFHELLARGESDVSVAARYFPRLIDFAKKAAPDVLAEFAREHMGEATDLENILAAHWQGDRTAPIEAQFFARVLLQPYAESLAERAKKVDKAEQTATPTCPFCGARPAVGILRGEGDGAKRSLLCSLCSSEWPYRRILCSQCGEENKDRLPIYTAAQTDYVRVDACDSCKSYLKSVDLTKNGHAVPIVDELATAALNIWAEEQGYVKLETNILGM